MRDAYRTLGAAWLLACFVALLALSGRPAERDWRGVAEVLETLNSRQPGKGH